MIADKPRTPRLRRRVAAQRAAAFGALLILVALAAACSGSSTTPGVADVKTAPTASGDFSPDGSSASDSGQQSVLAYSRCMRENGVPGFPDPNSQGRLSLDASRLGVDPNSPQFQAANEACRDLLPPQEQGQRPDRETMLTYSKCMREHGISDFPDPNAEGALQIQAQPGSDLDPNTPQFQAAQEACKQYLPNGREVETETE